MKKIISVNLYKENRRKKTYKNISSIYINNTYTMFLDEIKTTINADQLIRENDEFKFVLDIKKKKASYLLKENNMLLEIFVEKVYYDNSKLILEYKLESDNELTKIEIIDKEDKNE